jgi:hypothetical protein
MRTRRPGKRQPYYSHDNYARRIRTLCTTRQIHPHVTKLIMRQQISHATSHAPTYDNNTSPSCQHDGPRNRNHMAAHKHHCAQPPHAIHSAPENELARTRGSRATLTEALPGCPASTECCQSWTTAGTCRTHEQLSHHTMAPDTARAPSQSPATHPIATHRTASITSTIRTAAIKTSAVCASDSDTKPQACSLLTANADILLDNPTTR